MKKVTRLFATVRDVLILTICIALYPSLVMAEDAAHALDGKSYVVEVLKTGDQLFANENLEFENGKFETTFMEDKGYATAEYSTSPNEGAVKWKAISKNKSGDSLVWEGSESEGVIQGTVTKGAGKDSGTVWSFKSARRE